MARRQNKLVLVVDDDPYIRDAVADLLEFEGYQVHTASNGKEALDWLHAHPAPWLVVLDLMMPVMNGWELVQQMRQHPELAQIPVVVTTASFMPGHLPVQDVLEKPFEADDLIDAVRTYAHG